MHTQYEPPQTVAKQSEPPGATENAQARALDAARAAFRAGWQARLERERKRVETANRIATWSDRLFLVLFVLGVGGWLLLRLRFGVDLPDGVLLAGVLGLVSWNLAHIVALLAGVQLKRSADRLEAGEVR